MVDTESTLIWETEKHSGGLRLIYRLYEAVLTDEDGHLLPSYHLEISQAPIPASCLLPDLSANRGDALRLSRLLAKATVPPCCAEEVLEELLP